MLNEQSLLLVYPLFFTMHGKNSFYIIFWHLLIKKMSDTTDNPKSHQDGAQTIQEDDVAGECSLFTITFYLLVTLDTANSTANEGACTGVRYLKSPSFLWLSYGFADQPVMDHHSYRTPLYTPRPTTKKRKWPRQYLLVQTVNFVNLALQGERSHMLFLETRRQESIITGMVSPFVESITKLKIFQGIPVSISWIAMLTMVIENRSFMVMQRMREPTLLGDSTLKIIL